MVPITRTLVEVEMIVSVYVKESVSADDRVVVARLDRTHVHGNRALFLSPCHARDHPEVTTEFEWPYPFPSPSLFDAIRSLHRLLQTLTPRKNYCFDLQNHQSKIYFHLPYFAFPSLSHATYLSPAFLSF